MNEPLDPGPLPNSDPPQRIPPDFLEDVPSSAEELPTVLPVRKKGWPWLAWPVILAVVSFIFLGVAQHHQEEAKAPPPAAKELDDITLRFQALTIIGQLAVFRDMNIPVSEEDRKRMLEQAKVLNTGSVKQRLDFVIVAGELAGGKEALQRLEELKRQLAADKDLPQPTAEQVAVMGVLQRLYGDYAMLQFSGPSVSTQSRTRLVDQLGWFGELALAPQGLNIPGRRLVPAVGAAGGAALSDSWTPNPSHRKEVLAPAQRTFYGLAIGFVVFLGAALVGLVALTLFVTLALSRKLSGGLNCGSAHGGVYAETFALWLLLFLGLSLAAHQAPPEARMLASAVGMFLSLIVLGWPVVRGVSWAQVRQDIGWTAGRQPALEPAIGVGCYVMGLPLLIVGGIIVLALTLLQQALEQAGGAGEGGALSPASRAAHPIFGELIHADWWERIQIFLLASVAAPIVEETMFRGVLYRHLREASCRTPYLFSVLFSATVTNFIFAAIHPQGQLAIPLLMSLAYSFTLAREWRGTLIPSMVGHGLSNGLVTLLIMVMLGES